MKKDSVGEHQNAEAFERMVRHHQRSVFAVAYAKLGNSHDAEDVKQQVFMDAWRNMHKLNNPDTVAGWLFIAVTNRCKDHLRKMLSRGKCEAAFVETPPCNPGHAMDAADLEAALSRSIFLLPEELRTVIMMKYFAKMSYREISAMTGLSPTTIDGRLRTGKRMLKEKLVSLGFGMD